MNKSIATVDEFISPIRNDITQQAGNEEFVGRLYASLSLAVKRAPDLLKCEPESLQHAILSAAADNLLVDGNEAVILPYNNKKAKKVVANYQPMVHGLIKRMKEFGAVFSISCDVVRENDTFEANHADLANMRHSYPLNATNEQRGEIVAAYALFRDEQGRVIHPELMNKAQLEKVKSVSRFSGKDTIWDKWEEEMMKKSVIRRGFKRIPTDSNKLLDLMHRMDTMFEMKDITPAEPQRTSLWAPQDEKPTETATEDTPSAPDPSDSPSQGATETPEPKKEIDPPVNDFSIAQAFSDHCWGSKRTPADLEVDIQQFKHQRTRSLNLDNRLEKKLHIIQGIHMTRVSTKDVALGDSRAIKELSDIGIEEPEQVDASAS